MSRELVEKDTLDSQARLFHTVAELNACESREEKEALRDSHAFSSMTAQKSLACEANVSNSFICIQIYEKHRRVHTAERHTDQKKRVDRQVQLHLDCNSGPMQSRWQVVGTYRW